MYSRYAVYYTPEGPLAEAGAAWLGWNVGKGCAVSQPVVEGIDLQVLTQTPRKYGLHGTIKPPFHLSDGAEADDLAQELGALCRQLRPVKLDGLEVRKLAHFAALIPLGDQAALSDMAAQVVMGLDHFRAPPTPHELERRRKSRLTPAQERNLVTWGYPYVMEEFRFHITLTGRIKKEADPVLAALHRQLGAHLPRPFAIDSLTLAGQGKDGMFHEVDRFELGG